MSTLVSPWNSIQYNLNLNLQPFHYLHYLHYFHYFLQEIPIQCQVPVDIRPKTRDDYWGQSKYFFVRIISILSRVEEYCCIDMMYKNEKNELHNRYNWRLCNQIQMIRGKNQELKGDEKRWEGKRSEVKWSYGKNGKCNI